MTPSDRPPLPERPEDAHSPLPWRVLRDFAGSTRMIADPNDVLIAGVQLQRLAHADAKFIVTAANSFDRWRAALLAIAAGVADAPSIAAKALAGSNE